MPELQHTLVAGSCETSKIADLGETADNEYYMSAMKTNELSRARALRGRYRIQKIVEDLIALRAILSCAACVVELDRQIKLQKEAIQEIDHVWRVDPG